jgi:excisionase family DNA binding protein
MMLRYPAWFSALDRRRIDQILADQRAPIVDYSSANRHLVIFRHEYPSVADAVQSVLAVFEVVVERLQIHRDHQPTTILQSEAHRLLGDVIAWAEVQRPSTAATTVDFEATVRTELLTRSWWLQFVNTVPEPAASVVQPAPDRVPDDRVPLSIQETAERFGVSDDTIRRMVKKGKLPILSVGKKTKRIPQAAIDRLLATGEYPKR